MPLTGITGEGLAVPRGTADTAVPEGSVVGLPGGTGVPVKPGKPYKAIYFIIITESVFCILFSYMILCILYAL